MLIFDVKIAYDAKTFQLRSQWEQAGHASAPVHLDQSQNKTHFLTNRRAAIFVNDGLWVLTFGSWGHLLTIGSIQTHHIFLKHFLPPWISDPSLQYWHDWARSHQVGAVDDKLSVLSRTAAAGKQLPANDTINETLQNNINYNDSTEDCSSSPYTDRKNSLFGV